MADKNNFKNKKIKIGKYCITFNELFFMIIIILILLRNAYYAVMMYNYGESFEKSIFYFILTSMLPIIISVFLSRRTYKKRK